MTTGRLIFTLVALLVAATTPLQYLLFYEWFNPTTKGQAIIIVLSAIVQLIMSLLFFMEVLSNRKRIRNPKNNFYVDRN